MDPQMCLITNCDAYFHKQNTKKLQSVYATLMTEWFL